MISNVLLYEITLKQKVPFLLVFKRSRNIQFLLHYRVDEDRCWYTKMEGKKLINEHHTKNNVEKSMKIMDGILDRLRELSQVRDYDIIMEKLSQTNPGQYELIRSISKDVDKVKKVATEKEKLKGVILG